MTTELLDVPEQIVKAGVDWQRFKAIQAAFDGIPGIRLNYCEGELEIVGISKEHEALRCLLALLLGAYFEELGIEFFPSGSYSQVVEGVAEYQADLSYCLETDRDVPDLCVEIVITSGSKKKLQKYRRRGVPEVWFWRKGKFTLHKLEDQGYVQIFKSELLPHMNFDLLVRCLSMSSSLEALRTFRRAITSPE
jgi:Uma2 family endonuclease